MSKINAQEKIDAAIKITITNFTTKSALIKSWINEKDIGNMCAYLITDEANKVSGQVIAVDGNAERMD